MGWTKKFVRAGTPVVCAVATTAWVSVAAAELPEAQARVREFENQALKYLGGAPVLPPLETCLSDGAHKYGVSPVHYADCCYRFMARRLEHTLGAISEKELYAEHERQYGDFINLLFHSID